MMNIPGTMNASGLSFLSALASKSSGGVFLDINPLFGASTDAIAKGRQIDAPIHSIDTFENAPWIRKRVGLPLSRPIFDKLTRHIPDLIVHEGISPDIVSSTWNEKIGLYFDSAIQSTEKWSKNLEFFKSFFNEDCIICGDNFAGGYPDIVQNVYDYIGEQSMKLSVVGRLWALTHKDDSRIDDAVDMVMPKLENTTITTEISGTVSKNKAGVWSKGVHQKNPLETFLIETDDLQGSIIALKDAIKLQEVDFGTEPIRLDGANKIFFLTENDIGLQFSILRPNGRTINQKALKSGQIFHIGDGEVITSVRLTN